MFAKLPHFPNGVGKELNEELVLRKKNTGHWRAELRRKRVDKWGTSLLFLLRTACIHLATISAPKIFIWMTLATCSQLTMCQWKITHSTIFGKTNWSLLAGKLRHYMTWIGKGVGMGRVEGEEWILPKQVLWNYQGTNEYIVNNKI